MKQHRYNIGNKKKIAFEMFKSLKSPVETGNHLGVSTTAINDWYSQWMITQKTKEPVCMNVAKAKEPYWETEQDLINSFNPIYSADELTGEERNIYLNKVASCRI